MAKRKPVKASPQKEETPFKGQYAHTSIINSLASDLNTIIDIHIGEFKKSNFYHRLQKLLRKEPSESRILLLNQLKQMEINPAYPSKAGFHKFNVTGAKNKIIVNLEVLTHVWSKKFESDCYCYKVVLLTWDKSNKSPQHNGLHSDWIDMQGGKPEFEFVFPKPDGTTHWLLCIRQTMGLNKKRLATFASECMYIADAGTFVKKEQALLDKVIKEKSQKPSPENIADDIVRVKPKRFK